jgi:thiol:disulfide interchange protein DsbG
MIKNLLIAGAMAALFASPAFAQGDRHPELDRFEKKDGGKVEFLGHAYGLDGWLLMTKEGKPRYAYTTPEGGLVLGMLIDPEGKVKTGEQLKAYMAKNQAAPAAEQEKAPPEAAPEKASKSEQLYAEVEKAAWIAAGNASAPHLYMFVNVNCGHCQEYWKDLSGALKSGSVQVRLVPFGAAPANREGGAALLSVDDPARAWNAYIAGDKSALARDKIADGALAKLDANTALAEKWKLRAAPFTLYREAETGSLIVIAGKRQNPMLVVADLMKQ